MRFFCIGAVALVAAFSGLAGCGGDSLGRQPVSGSVNVNGAPLEKGTVNFQPVDKGIPGAGKVAGGKFSIARKDGLPVGKYRVGINAPVPGTGSEAPAGAMPGEPLPPPQELIPEDWNTKSEHFVDVSTGKNDFNFDVKGKAK